MGLQAFVQGAVVNVLPASHRGGWCGTFFLNITCYRLDLGREKRSYVGSLPCFPGSAFYIGRLIIFELNLYVATLIKLSINYWSAQ